MFLFLLVVTLYLSIISINIYIYIKSAVFAILAINCHWQIIISGEFISQRTKIHPHYWPVPPPNHGEVLPASHDQWRCPPSWRFHLPGLPLKHFPKQPSSVQAASDPRKRLQMYTEVEMIHLIESQTIQMIWYLHPKLMLHPNWSNWFDHNQLGPARSSQVTDPTFSTSHSPLRSHASPSNGASDWPLPQLMQLTYRQGYHKGTTPWNDHELTMKWLKVHHFTKH